MPYVVMDESDVVGNYYCYHYDICYHHYYNSTATTILSNSSRVPLCTGYHNGAVLAYRDFNTGNDMAVDQHPCTGNSTDYCNGYVRGYNDEADFLG